MFETEAQLTPMFSDDPAPGPSAEFQERRKQTDRRGSDRQGKYDRRRNRCGHCQHFDAAGHFCRFHQKPMESDDFACPAFQQMG